MRSEKKRVIEYLERKNMDEIIDCQFWRNVDLEIDRKMKPWANVVEWWTMVMGHDRKHLRRNRAATRKRFFHQRSQPNILLSGCVEHGGETGRH